MGLLSHVFVPSSGRLGPARAEVGLGFAVVGWFRRFRLPSSPSSAGLVPFPSAFVFSSLALSGFARSGPGVSCWCLLFPSSFAFPSSGPGWPSPESYTTPNAVANSGYG